MPATRPARTSASAASWRTTPAKGGTPVSALPRRGAAPPPGPGGAEAVLQVRLNLQEFPAELPVLADGGPGLVADGLALGDEAPGLLPPSLQVVAQQGTHGRRPSARATQAAVQTAGRPALKPGRPTGRVPRPGRPGGRRAGVRVVAGLLALQEGRAQGEAPGLDEPGGRAAGAPPRPAPPGRGGESRRPYPPCAFPARNPWRFPGGRKKRPPGDGPGGLPALLMMTGSRSRPPIL
jgi:hypothetical protein